MCSSFNFSCAWVTKNVRLLRYTRKDMERQFYSQLKYREH